MNEKRNLRQRFARYASLNVLGMLGLSCYILADTFFVSLGLGAEGLAALNLAIPIYSLVHGSGLLLGMGGATAYAIARGRQEPQAAAIYPHTLYAAWGLAFLFAAAGLLLPGTLAGWLGADAETLGNTTVYLRTILLFAPLFLLNNVYLCFMRNDGQPRLAMAAMVTGSLSNVLLDYVFIFPCGMGMFGAAFATGLAPAISLLVLFLVGKRGERHFRLAKMRVVPGLYRRILPAGVPSLVTEVSSGLVMITLNAVILRLQGNLGVAAYGVVANLSLVALAICTGIGQGIQPLLSEYHGRGEVANVRTVLRYALVTVAAVSLLLYALIFLGADAIAALFNSQGNARLQAIAVEGMRQYFLGIGCAGCNVVLAAYLAATERPATAQLLALLRGVALIVPVILGFSALWGMTGCWLAFPVTEAAVLLLALCLERRARRVQGAYPAPLPPDRQSGVVGPNR